MKKILFVGTIVALSLTSAALASDLLEEMPYAPPGNIPSSNTYIGIEGGYGLTNWKIFANNNSNFEKDGGVVGRAFFGYDFNKYWAIEFGYTYFFNEARHEIDAANYNEMKTQIVDLLGKLKVPANEDANFYAKFGVDYLMTSIHKTGTSSFLMAEKNWHKFDVAYGIGADYSLSANVIANIEWLRHGAKIKVSDGHIQPYTDSFMFGLRYKFDI